MNSSEIFFKIKYFHFPVQKEKSYNLKHQSFIKWNIKFKDKKTSKIFFWRFKNLNSI